MIASDQYQLTLTSGNNSQAGFVSSWQPMIDGSLAIANMQNGAKITVTLDYDDRPAQVVTLSTFGANYNGSLLGVVQVQITSSVYPATIGLLMTTVPGVTMSSPTPNAPVTYIRSIPLSATTTFTTDNYLLSTNGGELPNVTSIWLEYMRLAFDVSTGGALPPTASAFVNFYSNDETGTHQLNTTLIITPNVPVCEVHFDHAISGINGPSTPLKIGYQATISVPITVDLGISAL